MTRAKRRVRVLGPSGVETGSIDNGTVVTSGGTRIELLDSETLELPTPYELLLPVEPPEVWCAGVTYERSRDARIEESGSDVYARVYDAERPELFLKDADCRRTVGPRKAIGVRSDSHWNVPEAEIGLVLGKRGAILGYTIGNDVSSREIEGENPLYLPQAKTYDGSCAIGPAIVPASEAPLPIGIHLEVFRDGVTVAEGSTSTASLHRTFDDLLEHLGRALSFPHGVFLLTGTGIVGGPEFSLSAGDLCRIEMDGLGVLENPVVSVGRPALSPRTPA
jgi:2-dehydro-3-deoxy-D-arabinonate dehydratase